MVVIPPAPMPPLRSNSVGNTVAEPTLKGLVGKATAFRRHFEAAIFSSSTCSAVSMMAVKQLWVFTTTTFLIPIDFASSFTKHPNSWGKSSVVLGASVKERSTVSPKIWQDAVAVPSLTRTRWVADVSWTLNLAEVIVWAIILLFWTCEAKSSSCPKIPNGTQASPPNSCS